MLASVLVASSLWLAAAEAGARNVPAQEIIVPVEKIADEAGRDVAWIVGSHAFDLYTTALGLKYCPECVEGNPLGFSVEARIAMKMAGSASAALTCWGFRRHGHANWARAVRWGTVAINGLIGANNLRLAIKGR